MSMPALHMNDDITLSELLHGIAEVAVANDRAISGVASDSRKLREGYVFLAIQGVGSHGIDYVQAAVDANAAAIVWDSSTASEPVATEIPTIAVANLAACVGRIGARFYAYPARQLQVIGVTGTNGKTTVAWLIAQCLQHLGRPTGYIGTLGSGINNVSMTEGLTTPSSIDLQECLAGFVADNASHAAIEVSSHALDQGRVDGVEFEAVLFTNLSRDHLDYHGDMRSYFEAKAALFLDYAATHKIINLDSEYGEALAKRCGQDVVTVSTNFDRVANGRPYVFVRSVVASTTGSKISVSTSWGEGEFELNIPGDFNVANAAIALAYLLATGTELGKACDVLELVTAPPGRMQRVIAENFSVFVDYAHTPHALESALRALRPHTPGKIYCVFGCGGDRDKGKRPMMGRIAERLADCVVITSDNPRSEPSTTIMSDITTGFMNADTAVAIEDRAAAIAWAIRNAAAGDSVLIAGKGHENYQEIDGQRIAFSDLHVAQSAVAVE